MSKLNSTPATDLLGATGSGELRRCARRRPFRTDDVILREGEHNAALFVVEEGTLHASRSAGRRRVFLGALSPGSAFGEVSLFDPGPTSATVTAISDGAVLEIDRPILEEFVARHPAEAARFLIGLLAQVTQRVRRTDNRLVDSLLWGAAGPAQEED